MKSVCTWKVYFDSEEEHNMAIERARELGKNPSRYIRGLIVADLVKSGKDPNLFIPPEIRELLREIKKGEA